MPKNAEAVKVIFMYESVAMEGPVAMEKFLSAMGLRLEYDGSSYNSSTKLFRFILEQQIEFQCFVPLQGFHHWRSLLSNAKIVVFMVDSNKPSTFDSAMQKLEVLKEQLNNFQFVFVDVATRASEQPLESHTPPFDTTAELLSMPLRAFVETRKIDYAYISGLDYTVKPGSFQESFSKVLVAAYKKLPAKANVLESTSSSSSSSFSSPSSSASDFVLSQPRPRPRPFSLFGSAAENPYLLKREASSAERDFSNHFRDIYIVLRDQVRTFHMSIVAKACQTCQDTGSVLNQENLQGRANEDSSSRTAQTLRVMDKLSRLANQEQLFLTGFQRRYSDDYKNTFMARSAKAVEWAAGEEVNEVTNHERIIQLLCHAENNPRSRTARIVKDMFEHPNEWQSPTSSVHTPSRRQ